MTRTTTKPIVLQIRPRDVAHFAENVITCAQEAGFDRLPNSVLGLGLVDRDQGQEIAAVTFNSWAHAIGKLDVIEIHIDPHTCATERFAGSRLTAVSAEYAELMGGVLCDGQGRPLSEARRQAIAGRIDAIVNERIEASAPKPAKHPDGSWRIPGHVSFVHSKTTARGKFLRAEYFDTEPMGWHAGHRRGIEMAVEMLDFIKAHRVQHDLLPRVLASAFGCELATGNTPSRDNVANGFVRAMVEMVRFGARNANFRAWADAQIQSSHEAEAETLAYDAERRSRTAKRAAATRKARRAEAAMGGAA